MSVILIPEQARGELIILDCIKFIVLQMLSLRPTFQALNYRTSTLERFLGRGVYSVNRIKAVGKRAVAFRRHVVVPAAAIASPSPDPQTAEAAEDAALAAGSGAIYGVPRREWLGLQFPSRYLGNEWGAVHKPWDSATVRFTLAYPEVRTRIKRAIS